MWSECWFTCVLVSSHINTIGRYVMRVLVYLCVVSSHINIIGWYVMRVLVYLCAGVFSYQYHRSVCDESVGLPVCRCNLISIS